MVVIEAQSGAHCEPSHPDQVLYEPGLLAILRVPSEVECRRRVLIENGSPAQAVCDDVVIEPLANRREGSLAARLPFVPPSVAGDAAAQIPFAKSTILPRPNRSRQRIRPHPRRNVPHHPPNRAEQRRRKNMLVGHLPRRLLAGSVLPRPRRFLA